VNKAELVAKFQEQAGLDSKAAAERAVDSFLDVVKGALQSGESVNLVGFGSFKVVAKPARDGRNPRTGEKIKILASKNVKFAPGKGLKDSVK
jgi:DNA-binding protein HU-beta